MEPQKTQSKPEASDKDLTITIETSQGNWTNTFPKTAKVQDVIDATISHFGFAQNGKYELRRGSGTTSELLKPERTLVSYHIQDGDVLVFTDLGPAV